MSSDATALSAALQAGRVSAVELVEESIAAIEAGDRALNAVVVRDFERARAAAGEADRRLAAGEQLPLLGVPITIKESFDVEGLPTSWGLEAFRGTGARGRSSGGPPAGCRRGHPRKNQRVRGLGWLECR
jgi:amidase